MKSSDDKQIEKLEDEAKKEVAKKHESLKKIRYFIYFSAFIILSILTLYYIYNIFDKPSKIFIFNLLPISIILSLIGLLGIYFISDGLRLYFVLKTLECDIEFKNVFKLVFINMFISNITPFATGGGFVQVYFLTKRGISLGDAIAATTIRTIVATIIIFFTAPFVIFTGKSIETSLPLDRLIIYMSLFALGYIIFFYIVIFNNKLVKKLVYNILVFIKNKNLISDKKFGNIARYLFEEINIFSKSLTNFFKGKKVFIFSAIFLAVIFLLAELSFSVLLMIGMGYDPEYWLIVLRQLVVIFFMYFAPTPGATGIAEGGFSIVFKNYVRPSDMFPLIFSWRFFTKYIGIIIGLIIFFRTFLKGSRSYD